MSVGSAAADRARCFHTLTEEFFKMHVIRSKRTARRLIPLVALIDEVILVSAIPVDRGNSSQQPSGNTMKNDAKRKVRKTVAMIAVTAFMICTSAAAYAACNTYLAGKCKTKFVNCMKINGSDCEQKYIACMQAAGCTSML